jgi:hypothetical protein
MRIQQPAPAGRSPKSGVRVPAAAGALVVALAVAACGGSAGAAVPPSSAPVTEAPGEATATPKPTPTVTTVQVDQEAWFAGFHITFGAATAEITQGRGGSVTIEAKFENTGSDDARLDATLNLASAGETAREGMLMDLPRVPGGTSGKGAFAFDVEDSFTFDDAVLTLGLPDNQQAVVPLTAMAGTAVTQEPITLTLSGTGKAGDLQLDLAGGEVRADSPWSHGQMAKGTLVVTIDYSATFNSDFAGGFAFTGENVALRLPDGTTVGVIQDGRSQSIELLSPKATTKHLFSRFEIEDPAAGDYVLLVRSFDNAEDEIPFSIP